MSASIANSSGGTTSVLELTPHGKLKKHLSSLNLSTAVAARILRQQDVLEGISQERSNRHSTRYEKRLAASREKADIRDRIRAFERDCERSGVQMTEADHEFLKLLKDRLREIEAEFTETRGHEDAPTINDEGSREWLMRLRGSYQDAQVTLAPDEDPKAVLDEARGAIQAGQSDLNEIDRSPLPQEAAYEKVREVVEAAAQEGAPDWEIATRLVQIGSDTNIKRQGHFELPTAPHDSGMRTLEIGDGVGLLCWLHKDQILAKIKSEMEVFYADKTALSRADREARVAKISQSILQAGLREEAAISALERRGERVLRRNNADLRAVFGILRAR